MRQSWLAADTGNSLNSNMPSAFSDYVIGHIAGLVAQQVENDIWTGADANGGEFEGFLTATTGIFVVDGNVNACDYCITILQKQSLLWKWKRYLMLVHLKY